MKTPSRAAGAAAGAPAGAPMSHFAARALVVASALVAASALAAAPHPMARRSADQLTFHATPARTGWVDDERTLTPASVAGGRFGLAWESPPLDAAGSTPPRLFASPLYLARARIRPEGGGAFTGPVVFAATTTGWVYAIHAPAAGQTLRGTSA